MLRTELGVLVDNLARVFNRVHRKAAAKPKEAEETTNSDFKKESKEEEVIQRSTVLCKF